MGSLYSRVATGRNGTGDVDCASERIHDPDFVFELRGYVGGDHHALAGEVRDAIAAAELHLDVATIKFCDDECDHLASS